MPKVLARAGVSLADIYDVRGSIAGVDELESRGVSLVHEMGATIFSERLVGNINRLTTGAIAQNINWNLTLVQNEGVFRILGVSVIADTLARTLEAQVSLRAVSTERELPIFVWDNSNDVERRIRMVDDGAAVADMFALMTESAPSLMPSLAIGLGHRERVGEEIVFRGTSTAFGAGTVTVVALIYMAGAIASAGAVPSSIGLSLPGW